MAGTSGTTPEFVACVSVGVGDNVGVLVAPGVVKVGTNPRVVDVRNVVLVELKLFVKDPMELLNDVADAIALGDAALDVILKGINVTDGIEEVRCVGKLLTISVDEMIAGVLAPADGDEIDPVIDA
jgi:hypothetical protein